MDKEQASQKTRARSFGRWLGIYFLSIALQLLVGFILVKSRNMPSDNFISIQLLANGLIYFILYMAFSKDRAFPFRLKPFLLGACLAVPLALISSFLIRLFFDVSQDQVLKEIIQEELNYLFVLYPVILAPICEELFFRKLGHESLENFPKPAQALVLAAFFAILHLQVTGNFSNDFYPVFGAFIIGLVNSVIYMKTGSIWSSIGLHMVNNLLASLF